jgi:hypothetical protein
MAQLADFQVVGLRTHTDCYVEPSSKYMLDEVRRRLGLVSVPLAEVPAPRLAWKIIRKGIRMTVLSGFRYLAAATGNGASISLLLKKPGTPGGLCCRRNALTSGSSATQTGA